MYVCMYVCMYVHTLCDAFASRSHAGALASLVCHTFRPLFPDKQASFARHTHAHTHTYTFSPVAHDALFRDAVQALRKDKSKA